MGATLLDGAYVEKNAMVAAGALVRQNTRIPFGEVCRLLLPSVKGRTCMVLDPYMNEWVDLGYAVFQTGQIKRIS